jgi:hypothetical protein
MAQEEKLAEVDEKIASRKQELLDEARSPSEAAEAKVKTSDPEDDQDGDQQDGDQQRDTLYMIFTSESAEGPWGNVGEYSGRGQKAAKTRAAEEMGVETAKTFYFIAIPKSSYKPNRPKIDITFAD